MPDSETNQPNGAAPSSAEKAPSLRDIAEAAYDDLTADDGDADDTDAPDVDEAARPRDARGRFTAKDMAEDEGEAAGDEPTQPREDEDQSEAPRPAPDRGEAVQAPANWPAADREMFARLDPEGQSFLLERHSQMEGDYQRRVQANARAAEFVNALEPAFSDPVIQQSLAQNRITPLQAIGELLAMQRRFVQDPAGLIRDMAQRANLDPATLAPSRPGQPQFTREDMEDPAIRSLADHIGRQSSVLQQVQQRMDAMQQAAINAQTAQANQQARWWVDQFADEVGPDGQKLRPDFDKQAPYMRMLIADNPNPDLAQAYQTARWMNPETRADMIAAERAAVEQKAANSRASLAARQNIRGRTSEVAKPPDDGTPKGLRETLEQSADEIGF